MSFYDADIALTCSFQIVTANSPTSTQVGPLHQSSILAIFSFSNSDRSGQAIASLFVEAGMPLLSMTGYPSSGKTRWATIIKAAFDERIAASSDSRISNLEVVLINDEVLGIDKMDYSESRREKAARGLLFSAVERHLGKECIVICDGLNYIKGFRYQLSCSAKALGTSHCLVRKSNARSTENWLTTKGSYRLSHCAM